MSATVQALNKTVSELSPEDVYARLFYARIDAAAGELTYVSAGHEPALLVRSQFERVRRLESTGAVMGLTRRSEYRQRTLPLEPGDLLIGFSDGVTDAVNTAGRQWNEVDILEVVMQNPNAPAVHLTREIMAAVERFSGDAAPADDRTVVVIRFYGQGEHTIVEEKAAEPMFAAA